MPSLFSTSGAPAREAATRAHELRLRILAALVLAPPVLLVTWAGGLWFALMTMAAAVLMAREWTNIVHAGNRIQFLLHAMAAIGGGLAAIALHRPGAGHYLALQLAATGLLSWIASLFLSVRAKGFTIHHLTGVPYVMLAAFAVIALRNAPGCGLHALFFLFAVIWTADSLAYFAGRALGGPKLAPRISPNKTWSGFFGAVAGGALAGLGYGLFLEGGRALSLMLTGALLGGFEQLGDLYESAMKRRFGHKDSGTLIPGHGGILDRVDGLVAAAGLALLIGTLATGSLMEAGCGLFGW